MPTHVMTIIANPAIKKLSPSTINTLEHVLQQEGATVEKQEWLAEGEACDVLFSGSLPANVVEKAYAVAGAESCDVAIQPLANRRKKLLVADMDSTMITIECIDELADFAGLKEHVAQITERAMNGELNFEEALTERVALLKGMDASVLQRAYDERVQFMPGAKTLIQTMRAFGASCILVSGGFTFFTERVKDALGFNAQHANTLDIKDGKLTGKVILPILGKEAKLATLQHYKKTLHVATENTLAVGDGANDLPMLKAAGIGVAYHAKPNVKKEAGVRVDYNGLTALLYLQGYKKEEHV